MRLLPRWHTPESVADRLIRGLEDGSVSLEASTDSEELSVLRRQAAEYRWHSNAGKFLTLAAGVVFATLILSASSKLTVSADAELYDGILKALGQLLIGALIGYFWSMLRQRSTLRKTRIVLAFYLKKIEALSMLDRTSEAVKKDSKVTS